MQPGIGQVCWRRQYNRSGTSRRSAASRLGRASRIRSAIIRRPRRAPSGSDAALSRNEDLRSHAREPPARLVRRRRRGSAPSAASRRRSPTPCAASASPSTRRTATSATSSSSSTRRRSPSPATSCSRSATTATAAIPAGSSRASLAEMLDRKPEDVIRLRRQGDAPPQQARPQAAAEAEDLRRPRAPPLGPAAEAPGGELDDAPTTTESGATRSRAPKPRPRRPTEDAAAEPRRPPSRGDRRARPRPSPATSPRPPTSRRGAAEPEAEEPAAEPEEEAARRARS